jgi:HNH endonuclease
MFHGFAEGRDRLPMIVVLETGCWLWTGSTGRGGYGRWWKRDFDYGRPAHVVIWEAFNGPVPEGKQLDHLCRVKCCVNEAHLEPVTMTVNLDRMFKANGRGRAREEHFDEQESDAVG